MIVNLKNDSLLLKFLVFFTPFSYAPIFDVALGAPGLKLFNVTALVLVLVFMLKGGLGTILDDRVQTKAFAFIVIYVLFFTIAFFRTFAEFNDLPMQVRDEFGDAGRIRFFLSYYVKPMLFLVSAVYIIRFIKTEDAINNVIKALVASATVFSVIVIALGLDDLLSFSGVLGRSIVREEFRMYLGMHYNSVATMLLISFPLSMYVAKLRHGVRASLFYKLAPFILFFAGVVSQSRTAILLLAVSVMIIYIVEPVSVEKRFRKLVFITTAFIMGGVIGLPFLTMFFDVGAPDQNPIDFLLSGRLLTIWIPLGDEILSDPFLLLFGFGLYGVMLSDAFFMPDFFQATHAHNAYLNFAADTGVILLLVLMWIVISFLIKIYKIRGVLQSGVLAYLFTVIMIYLYSGITERNFFPGIDNFWLFPAVALTIAAYRISKRKLKE